MDDTDARRRIDALRAELEHADYAIVEAISRRQRIVETVAAVKREMELPLRDTTQETIVLERCDAAASQLGADPFLIGRVFRELITHAVRTQEFHALERGQRAGAPLRIGFQGADGAYGQAAAMRHFSPARTAPVYTAWPTFRDL